jgi:rubredoxin
VVCSGCGSDSFGAVFTAGVVRHRCNGCGNLFDAEQTAPSAAAPSAAKPSVERRPVETPTAAAMAPASLLKSARARVRELTREINRLKALTKERDELRRLIAAAKQPSPKRTATVRQLRATGE